MESVVLILGLIGIILYGLHLIKRVDRYIAEGNIRPFEGHCRKKARIYKLRQEDLVKEASNSKDDYPDDNNPLIIYIPR